MGGGHFAKRKRILLSPQFRSLPSGDPKCNPDRKEERSFGRWFGRGESGRKDSDFGPSGQGWAEILLCGGFANSKSGHRVTHSTDEILFACFYVPKKGKLHPKFSTNKKGTWRPFSRKFEWEREWENLEFGCSNPVIFRPAQVCMSPISRSPQCICWTSFSSSFLFLTRVWRWLSCMCLGIFSSLRSGTWREFL